MKLLALLLGILMPFWCIGQTVQSCEREKYKNFYISDTKAIIKSEQKWNKKIFRDIHIQ